MYRNIWVEIRSWKYEQIDTGSRTQKEHLEKRSHWLIYLILIKQNIFIFNSLSSNIFCFTVYLNKWENWLRKLIHQGQLIAISLSKYKKYIVETLLWIAHWCQFLSNLPTFSKNDHQGNAIPFISNHIIFELLIRTRRLLGMWYPY